MKSSKLPVSVLIMAQNEEVNISYAIESVKDYFDQVIVVDSFSDDSTKTICLRYAEVECYEHRFASWSDQRNWILRNCAIRNDVVFFLDADEYVEREFVDELENILDHGEEFSAIYLKVKFIFLGKWIRFAYGHPKIKRIFYKEGLEFCGEGAREYAKVDEKRAKKMCSYLVHHDRKEFSRWILKHIANADREAALLVDEEEHQIDRDTFYLFPIWLKIKTLVRKNLWYRLPDVLRPLCYFCYRYFFRLGFLDGTCGFYYCLNHALWYQYLISIRVRELTTRYPR